MNRRFFGCVVALLISGAAIAAPSFSSLTIFGDSLSDNGNVFDFTTKIKYDPRPTLPFYTQDRWTDGSDNTKIKEVKTQQSKYDGVWHEQLARRLKTDLKMNIAPATASLRGGTNYSYGGAETKSPFIGVPGTDVQLKTFLKASPVAKNDSLYVFWAGGNDIFGAVKEKNATAASVKKAATDAVTNLNTQIRTLISKAENGKPLSILWADVPSLDRTPFAKSLKQDLVTALGDASKAFRNAWTDAIKAILKDAPGTTIYGLDIYTLMNNLLDGKMAFKPANTTDNIITTGTNFSGKTFAPSRNGAVKDGIDPDTFVFWDEIHPTSKIHSLIGDAAFELIPAPGAASLFAVVFFAAPRRRRVLSGTC